MVANVDWIFIAHRIEIGKEALKNGYRVVVAAYDSGRSSEITAVGMEFVNLPISRSGTNPFAEILVWCKMYLLYAKINPDVVYQVTMKPVIYGTLIAKFLSLKTVNGISGLGYNFTGDRKGVVQKTMIRLMRMGFHKKNNQLIFENNDDCFELQVLNIISKKNKIEIIKGVGVDLKKYQNLDLVKNDKVVLMLPTRMLWDKGVKEFVEAAKLLQEKYQGKAFFKLCGMIDEGNMEAVPEAYLKSIFVDGYLEWFGYQKNMLQAYASSDIVVLPSYREGMPTVLIEASAASLPLITTDAIGCKECVDEGVNGYKVPVKSIVELAAAMEKLINSPEDRIRMGKASRIKAEKEFDQKEVVKKHLVVFENMILNN